MQCSAAAVAVAAGCAQHWAAAGAAAARPSPHVQRAPWVLQVESNVRDRAGELWDKLFLIK